MTTDNQQVVANIRQVLVEETQARGETSGLLGAHAGELILSKEPSFKVSDYSCKRLKDFIERHVPELRVIGHSGSDAIYGLRAWPDLETSKRKDQPNMAARPQPSLWQIWTVSAGNMELAINKTTGHIRPIPSGDVVLENEIRLQSASSQTHQDIAKEFLNGHLDLRADLKAELLPIAQNSEKGWFWKWVERLKKEPEINHEFIEYRRQKLLGALEASLLSAGLLPDLVKQTVTSIRDSGRKPRSLSAGHLLPNKRGVACPPMPPFDIKSLIRDVVAVMDEQDLRSLKIPVGLVLDAIYRVNRG